MKERKRKKQPKIAIGVLITICICLLFARYTFAKNIENILIKIKGEIAEPILIIENDPSINITALNNEGIYNFKIKNYNNENKITDIKLRYSIEILASVDKSIEIDLYQNENKIELNNNRTDYIEFSNKKREENSYQIKLRYEKEKSESISEIMEKVQVKVHTEQMRL